MPKAEIFLVNTTYHQTKEGSQKPTRKNTTHQQPPTPS